MSEPFGFALALACGLNVFLGLALNQAEPIIRALNLAMAAMCACVIIYRSGQR